MLEEKIWEEKKMILKLEDDIFNSGPESEYINSEKIKRIRIGKKRIRIYLEGTILYIYVGITKHNVEEFKKIGVEICGLR